MGLLAYAKHSTAFDEEEYYAYMSFLILLQPLKTFFHILVLILVSSLAASSIDSLQNALACLLNSDILRLVHAYPIFKKYSFFLTRFLVVLINIPAIIISARKYSVLELFLLANLVCATSVLPIFLGLIKFSNNYLPAPTELGVLCGCFGGVITVIINGYILHVNKGHNPFYYFWLKNNNDVCPLCGSKTMITFMIVPVISLAITCIISSLDVMIRKEAARRPLIILTLDESILENQQTTKVAEENDKSQTEEISGIGNNENQDKIEEQDLEGHIFYQNETR